MLPTAESNNQFYVGFLLVIYDQELFDSKVQSIIEYAQINDAEINQTTWKSLVSLKFQLYVQS